MEGGFFLIQHVDLGTEAKGMEVIGHERPLGQEPSADIKSRFYSNTGDTLDYTYELEGDTLTIWFGERGSPAYYEGTLSEDGGTLIPGGWRVRGDLDQGRVAGSASPGREWKGGQRKGRPRRGRLFGEIERSANVSLFCERPVARFYERNGFRATSYLLMQRGVEVD